MPDSTYSQTRSQRAKDNEEARRLQRFYKQFDVRLPLAEAREMVAADRKKAQLDELLQKAQPAFIKDGKGIRGDVDNGKNKQIPGADGRGDDMQIKKQVGGGNAKFSSTVLLAAHVEGVRGTVEVGPGPFIASA